MAAEVAVAGREALLAAAAGIARGDRKNLLFGASGERLVGEDVAGHLEAALALMESRGWPHPTIYDALEESALDGAGDWDSRCAARDVMELLIRAQSGASYADYEAWNLRRGRRFEDVAALMLLAAAFARRYVGRGV
ncbi:hypothetical protein ACFY97_18715 [Streptomyces klenkii]|uniref:DUF6197 family protein n=1 Tax=Streptomyces klenkii TaxID=1420899 RepID=UPI0036E19CDA